MKAGSAVPPWTSIRSSAGAITRPLPRRALPRRAIDRLRQLHAVLVELCARVGDDARRRKLAEDLSPRSDSGICPEKDVLDDVRARPAVEADHLADVRHF